MRALFIIASAGTLLFLVWFFGRSASTMSDESRYRPKAEGSSLSVQTLQPNEKVVIVIQPLWREPDGDRLYQIEGGKPLRFGVKSLDLARPKDTTKTPDVVGKLSDEEVIGLDAYLLFLRRGYQVGAHAREEVVVGYYRAGSKIGEERFRISSSMFSLIRRQSGKIVHPAATEAVGDFPAEVFHEIVPPTLIEQRLKEPNQSLEPTRTSVTSPASAGAAPAARVAHL